MRVHELAKELGLSSKDCLVALHGLGVEAKSHMSAVAEAGVGLLREQHAEVAKPSEAVEPPPVEDVREPPPEEPSGPQPQPAEPVAEEPQAAEPVGTGTEPEETAPAEEAPVAAAEENVIRVRGAIIVRDLAESLGVRPNQLIAELMRMNVLASITQRVEVSVARKIAESHGFTLEHEKRAVEHRPAARREAFEEPEEEDKPEDLKPRAPVVTFLGHVDHGKTSLLDRIRDTKVVSGEHGGITQHIGAYTVDVSGRGITFLDTPGHAAFTAMRARGANLTDIAVIIIAADDGIMPQTMEALQHAKAGGVALMVAINKIDLSAADAGRVRQQLQAEDLTPEEWGGETICCEVSAETGEGVDHLLEMILLQADMLELMANPDRRARGYVIEAQLEPGMGPTAHLLVARGTLKIGDTVLCGEYCGKVRALISDHGLKLKEAGPSTPVKCLGLPGVTEAGAEFRVFANEKIARAIAQQTAAELKSVQLEGPEKKASLESLFEQIEGSRKLELKLILKADTRGSIEAIVHSLREIKSDKVALAIILDATGNITVNDVMLASASNAVILGFHVGREPGIDKACRRQGVETRLHHIIYELIDEVRDAMSGLLAPVLVETKMGMAEVRQVFMIGKRSQVAGCLVTEGTITPRFKVRVMRGDEELFEGVIESLKHFQDTVSEVRDQQECGIRLANFSGFEEGDLLEFYEVEEVKQTL